jgi:hypothetical protein
VSNQWSSHVRARRLAGRQKNLVTFAQARECGLSSHQISGLARRGEWERVFRGVFRVAPSEPAWQQRALAVCLAGGQGVAASHETAAALMALDGCDSTPRLIHVSAVRRLKIPGDGVMIHLTRRPFGIRKVLGVPATYVERVLLDLAGRRPRAAIELAVEDALRRRLTTVLRLDAALSRDGGMGRAGARVLREVVDARRTSAPTDSGLEARVAQALSRAGLGGVVRQHPVTRPDGTQARIDLAFPPFKIAVEVESYRWHSGRQA